MCFYCAHSTRSLSDKENVLCKKRGLVSGGSCCRHYKYNPLLRVPHAAAQIMPLDAVSEAMLEWKDNEENELED